MSFWERVGNWLFGTRDELTEQLIQDMIKQEERAALAERRLRTVTEELVWARRLMGEQNTQLARLDVELAERVRRELVYAASIERMEQQISDLEQIVAKYRGEQ